MLADRPILVNDVKSIQLLSVFKKHLVIGQFSMVPIWVVHLLERIYPIGPDCAGCALLPKFFFFFFFFFFYLFRSELLPLDGRYAYM